MSTLGVTSSAEDRKPPITHSSPSTTAPLASKRATGQGVASTQVKAPALPPSVWPALPAWFSTPPLPALPALPAPPALLGAWSEDEQPITSASKPSENTL